VPFILYFPAVLFAAWYGRVGAGVLATVLGAIAATVLWMEPQFVFALHSAGDVVQVALFVVLALFICLFVEMSHRTAASLTRAQLEIRTQAERFFVTLSSIGDAVIATDTTGRIEFMNPVAEEMTGWRFRGEAEGKPLQEIFRIINEKTRQAVLTPVEKVLKEGKRVALANATVLIAKDKTERAIEDTAAPILDGDEVVGVVLVFHDVTARRDARRKLEEAHARIDEILARMSDGFAIFDKEWRYVYVNERGAELAVKSKEELLGRKLWDLFADEIGKPSYQQLTRAMKEKVSVHFESFYEPWGKWFDLRAHPSSEGLALYFADITDRKNLQLAVTRELEKRVAEKTKELEERNKSLEALSYGLAHDLRAPLRAIEGFRTLLQDEYGSVLKGDGEVFCEKIASSTRHAQTLMANLLEYGRLAHAVLPTATVDLEACVRNVLQELASEIQEKSAKVKVEQPLPRVRGNETVLQQVFTNLIGNALKFQKLEVAPVIQIRAEDKGESVRILVKDNGVGISGEHLPKIFKPFERLHGRDKYPGTGLGLSIVQAGVQRMGGSLGVESQLGSGSDFWVELPKGDGI